jgi:hypothetical protein
MANDPQIRHTCETVKEALEIDVEMGTDSWQKEMAEVKVAWKSTDEVTPEQARTGKEPSLIGFQGIRCQAIFDVNIRRSILLTMSLYVNYFVTCYSYFADNSTYIVSPDRDIASYQLIVWHVC